MVRKILYVDDSAVMLELIKALLVKAGYEVATAKTVDDALRLAEATPFDLMVMDVNLAGDSGIMLMKFISFNHKGVPVILYSGGERDQAAVEKMLAQGATKYVQKRTGSELVAAVKDLCPLG